MKKNFYILFIILLVLFKSISCTDDVGENWKTFEGELVYSYLENRPEKYSEFAELLKRAGLKGMLSAYGEYTCFAPTNEAMRNYYNSLGVNFTIDSLRKGEMDTLARGHIVQNRYLTFDLSSGVMLSFNMNFHTINIEFDTIDGGILINGNSYIIYKDNGVYNGVVHGIDNVLKLTTAQLPNLMRTKKDISIFTEALHLTHLSDSLLLLRDVNYQPSKLNWGYDQMEYVVVPKLRLYGYTVFVEDNNLLKANGINSLADLIERAKELYPGNSQYDNDFTSRNNSLNRYIAYHITDRVIYKNKFFNISNAINGFIPDEYFETLLPNRIIRASNIKGQTTLNTNTNHTVRVVETKDNSAQNGVYHLLDNLLFYCDDVEFMLQNTRIRFDVASILPELTNNNIRCNDANNFSLSLITGNHWGFHPEYFKNIKTRHDSRFGYATANKLNENASQFGTLHKDFVYISGDFDVSFRLLPVPAGTYEFRIGFYTSPRLVQIYFDNQPIGIPRFIGMPVGFEPDSITTDNGLKNDQLLRYKGAMKAPNTFLYPENGYLIPARQKKQVGRLIVGIFSFTNYQAHTIRFRSVNENYSHSIFLDYFEFAPKIVFNPPGEGNYETRD